MYTSISRWVLLTSAVHGYFPDAKGSTVCSRRTLDNDVAKFLRERCADDGGVLTGSHWAVVLSTERVWGLVDCKSCRRVVVGQTDHKVVQTICIISSQTQHTISRYWNTPNISKTRKLCCRREPPTRCPVYVLFYVLLLCKKSGPKWPYMYRTRHVSKLSTPLCGNWHIPKET